MVRKKINSNLEDHNGIRLSSHEKVCAERMKTLFKSMMMELTVGKQELHKLN